MRGRCARPLVAGVCFGGFAEDVAAAAIRALDFADIGLDVQINARVAKCAAAAVATDGRGFDFDGLE